MPVIDCDLDHTVTWADTGVTDSDDLAALCRHDHIASPAGGSGYGHAVDVADGGRKAHHATRQLPNGDYLWTSPLGCTYTTSGRDP